MKHRQYIFNDISKKAFEKCEQIEIALADEIFRDMCYVSSKTKTFI